MSELSAEEKRRLLRERRQAKMSSGKATERLNNILTKGASVKTDPVKSVLETSRAESTSENPSAYPRGASPTAPLGKSNAGSSSIPSGIPHPSQTHDDPEVPDISSLLQTGKNGPAPDDQDMDAIMQKIFAGTGAGDNGSGNTTESTPNIFAEMMKTMGQDSSGIPETPENASYQTKLAVYHEYQQKSWKARFLLIRFIVHTFNFFYHYLNFTGFFASSHAFVRDLRPADGVGSFMAVFVSAEIAIISSYFMILSSNGVLGLSSRNHPASKLLSLASAVLPQASTYQKLLDSALVYWGGASILIGDLMLVVVLFGLASVFS
ncbi:hypothetical protein JCM33374_g4187 [Metschnikowia sp. JCM 33374]|nr:hypothetical protein JCM33374_g4187 [Metschnikowia sp. JCM 33374]